VRSTLLIADLGPQFAGWAGMDGSADERMICMVPPEIATSKDAQRLMREIGKRAGGDCDGCRACPLGT